MSIANLLEQLNLNAAKEGTPPFVAVTIKVEPKPVEDESEEEEGSESEEEFEDESEEEGEVEYFEPTVSNHLSRYPSIWLSHCWHAEGGPSKSLINALGLLEKMEDGCDLCFLGGVERCLLHKTDPTTLEAECRDTLNDRDEIGGVRIHCVMSGLSFDDDFSSVTNQRVFKLLGDSDFILAMEELDKLNNQDNQGK